MADDDTLEMPESDSESFTEAVMRKIKEKKIKDITTSEEKKDAPGNSQAVEGETTENDTSEAAC